MGKPKAGDLIGYRQKGRYAGRPIYLPGGGSEPSPENPVVVPVSPVPPVEPLATPAPAPAVQQLSPEDIRRIQEEAAARARAELQAELAPRLSQIDELAGDLQQRREAEAAAERARQEAEEAARRAEQTSLDRVNELEQRLNERDQFWQQELGRRDAIIAQERRLTELTDTRARLLQEAGNDIMPHLHAYVTGNSEEELRLSIERAKETSAQIARDAQEAMAQRQQQAVASWRATPTTQVTQPASPSMGLDPVNEGMGQMQGMTQDQLEALSPAEYARLRPQLLAFAGGNPNAGQNQGGGWPTQ